MRPKKLLRSDGVFHLMQTWDFVDFRAWIIGVKTANLLANF